MADPDLGIVNQAFDDTETIPENCINKSDIQKQEDIHIQKNHFEEGDTIKYEESKLNVKQKHVKTEAVMDFIYKLKGPAFGSVREKKLKKSWRRRSIGDGEIEDEESPSEDLSRSQYSLVSTDLTDGAVQLWLGLPDEVKYDPALEQFRQHYEKEHARYCGKFTSS
ncbi:hypothetical protein B5X24_HaOG210883 [Helicoverpa armigera]|uniref:Uncharacterized protein n=1 Tax=Helicoverpa armigera TaxID=29058 RepID=A0A2W1BG12_HELAM|nr:hypothetical protein B5X24_HaOG210883 [Helicoverpa armigera]